MPDLIDRLILTPPGGTIQEFTLSTSSLTIGRATTNAIVLPDPKASRFHARIDRSPDGWQIVDLGSQNGLRVNSERVARATLGLADVVEIGDTVLQFERGAPDPDPDLTRPLTAGDLDATVRDIRLPMLLHDAASPRVAVVTPERTWEVPFNGDTLTIGRSPSCDVVLDSDRVSRQHAVLQRKGSRMLVRDLHSTNGTWIRHARVSSAPVTDGDEIRIGSARIILKGEAKAEDVTPMAPRASDRRPPVLVVPGFGGSTLWLGSEQVWPAPRAVLTHPSLLRIDQPLEPRGLLDDVVIIPNLIRVDQYRALTEFLTDSLSYEAGKDLLAFAYDFRQDNRTSARRLAAAVDAWDIAEPITIIAHSMGSLVARYYVERLGGSKRVGRVIYLGAPHAGTPYAFASLVHGPDLLPLGLLNASLRNVLASYPSWYQILPTYPCISDQRAALELFVDETWLSRDHWHMLRDARAFRQELERRPLVRSVCVFGYGLKTITSATVERAPNSPCTRATFVVTPAGDGIIPETSSIIAGSEIHPVKQHHASLFRDNDVRMRLQLELARGDTHGSAD